MFNNEERQSTKYDKQIVDYDGKMTGKMRL